MAKRKHLPVLEGGKRYEGWMPFVDGEPLFRLSLRQYYGQPSVEIYATEKDARGVGVPAYDNKDVRRVTIIVEDAPKPKKRSR